MSDPRPSESGETQPTLRRSITLVHATAMVVGIIVGTLIFVQPSLITGAVPSVRGVMIVWLIAGALTLVGSLICAELSSAFPSSGGVYVYLRSAFSPALGFLWGWAMFWTMHTGIIAAIAMIVARYAGYFVPLGLGGQRAVAIAAIVILSAVNYLGVRQGSTLQTTFTIGKLLAIALIVAVGFALGPRASLAPAAITATLAGASIRDLVLAIAAGLFAFGGWHMVTYAAGETVDPSRTLPRALVIGTLLVTLCYIAVNAVYMYLLPIEAVITSKQVAADAANAVLGAGGAAVMSALVVFSGLGALNGIILAGPRVYMSMARDGLLFDWIGRVHAAHRTPHYAIALQAAWAAVLVLTGTYRELFTRVVYTEWIFFALMAAGLLRLRTRAEYRPAFRLLGGATLPVLFAIAAGLIVVNQVVAEPVSSATGLLLVAAGWPVYHFWIRKTITRRHAISHGD